MRVDVTPREATLQPGVPAPITVSIANTETIIAGFTIRVLGADPGWVQLDADDIALFPDESRTIPVLVTPPKGIAAGSRRIAVQIRELTPPYASTVAEIDLTVPPAPGMQLRADPLTITAGKRANYGLLVENTGNTNIKGLLAGADPENKVHFEFEPERVTLTPGQHAVVDMQAAAKRHFLGTPTVRSLSVFFEEPPAQAETAATEDERKPLATVTFVQRSVMSRGALSLLGLLFAATVFAVVITIALSKLVAQTTADRDLALQVAAARNAASGSGQSGVSGTVTLLTTRKPVAGVTVSVFSASNTSTAIKTTTTNSAGAYAVNDLAAGQYKISFRGAGFVQVWYPGAADDSDATTITLSTGQIRGGLNVSLGGVPATIAGTVTGSDVSASTLYLETVPQGTTTTASARTSLLAQPPVPVTPPNNGAAVVEQVPIGSDGSFTLSNVPSPSVYQLVLVKPGFATSSQRIDVSAGENRTGVQLTLNKGDGLIEGTITSQSGPLSGVNISATTGQQSTNTVSLTGAGTFTLRNLPTPGAFTVVASKSGYAPQTLTLNLTAGQKLTGVAITLTRTSASLHGVVLLLPKNTPAPGVEVTVTDGQTTVQTATQSTKNPGSWSVGGLPIPGTYTVTFSRSDLESQTVSVSLGPAGTISPGSISPGSTGSQITAAGITVSMQLATATLFGEIRQPGGPTVCNAATGAIGEASVTLSSGSASYSVTSASVGSSCGQYRIEKLPPGTYTLTVTAGTGTIPNSQVVTLAAGQSLQKIVPLPRPASMSGVVQCCTAGSNGKPGPRSGWTVFLYEQSQFPTSVLVTTVTDSQGRFTFTNLLSGTYIVAAGPTADPSDVLDTAQVNVQASRDRTGVVILVSR
jgi:5-hydroxyisourate hydrolase-like protein (transthyretin family)